MFSGSFSSDMKYEFFFHRATNIYKSFLKKNFSAFVFFKKKILLFCINFPKKKPYSIFLFVTYRIRENLHYPKANSISSINAPGKKFLKHLDFRNGQDLVNTGKRICESSEDNQIFTSLQ